MGLTFFRATRKLLVFISNCHCPCVASVFIMGVSPKESCTQTCSDPMVYFQVKTCFMSPECCIFTCNHLLVALLHSNLANCSHIHVNFMCILMIFPYESRCCKQFCERCQLRLVACGVISKDSRAFHHILGSYSLGAPNASPTRHAR